MNWIEAVPIPNKCHKCKEDDCYNCDHAGKRWFLSTEEELLSRRKILSKAIIRLENQIKAIDQELLAIKTDKTNCNKY